MDGRGLKNYGDCSVVLKDAMIAHRATVFEENTVVFMQHHRVETTGDIPFGYRATWPQRGRLAVAKLASRLTPAADPAAQAALLLHNAPAPQDEDFIEVHIYGPFSIQAVDAVHLSHSKTTGVRIDALRHKLKGFGIPLSKN